jgi:aspartyl protease family protein
MRNILLFAAVAVLLAGTASRFIASRDQGPVAMTTRSGAGAAPSPAAANKKDSGKAYVRLDRYSQFATNIEIEGKPFKGIIDTGASIVILRYEDAKALGLFNKGERWDRRVSTANGTGKAMSVRLNNLSIGDLVVYDVEALVLAPGAVSTNLIGMSLLRRLSKFEIKPDVIVLER